MALNPKLSLASRHLALNAALDVCNGGFMDIYTGSQPADPDAAPTGTKLARLALNATAFAAAAAGSKVANAISPAAGLADGTAGYYRLLKSDGTTGVWDGSVGLSASNLVLNSIEIRLGATVFCSAFTASMAA